MFRCTKNLNKTFSKVFDSQCQDDYMAPHLSLDWLKDDFRFGHPKRLGAYKPN